MAEERLSKLQKWILSHCLEEVFLQRNEAREFYGKKFPYGGKTESFNTDPHYGKREFVASKAIEFYDVTTEEHKYWNHETNRCDIPVEYTLLTPKGEYISTKAEEVSISRSFRNLSDKGLISRSKEWGPWHLTEKGFLIAKNSATCCTFVSFKDYYSKIEEQEAANKKRLSALEATFQGVSRKDESPEKAEKRRQLRFKELEFQRKFAPHTIFSLCCDSCKKKVVEFEIECGANEIKALMEELEAL